MRQLSQRVHFYYLYLQLALTVLPLYPLFRYYLSKPRLHPKAHALRRKWAKVFLKLAGLRLEVIGEADFTRTYVVYSNHASYMDIPVLMATLPIYMGFMAKAELAAIPIIGRFFRSIDIQVARGNSIKSAQAFKQAADALEEGKSIVIFPEGGIFPEPTQLKPFKNGAFQLAIQQQVPILPISMPDNWKILPDEEKLAKAGKIRIILHKPVETAGLATKDVESLKNRIFDLINEDLRS